MDPLSPTPGTPSRPQAGFTLVEVGFAVAVLALALGTAIVVMQRSFLSLDTARGLTYAAQIMQNELEKIRAMPWGDGTAGAGSGTTGVSAFPTTPTSVTIDGSFNSLPQVGGRFFMTRTASTVHSGMIKIVLTVTWESYNGRILSRSMVAYYG